MSAQMDYSRYNNNKSIDEYLEDRILGTSPRYSSILNMCLENGTMGRSDQIKLRELYPRLFDEVQKFLAQKNHGRVFIYEEEDKPKVINVFIHNDTKDNAGSYYWRRSASKSIKAYTRSMKLPSKEFVWIYDEEQKHKKMIEDAMKYQFSYDFKFIALRPNEEEQEETDY